MNIFAIAVNIHDHNWYDGNLHYQAERYTRFKHNLNPKNPQDPTLSRIFFAEHFVPNYESAKHNNTEFCFTISNLGYKFVSDLIEKTVSDTDFLDFKPNNLWDYLRKPDYYYIDHHQSHAAYAFLTSGFSESDILAIDGRGWNYNCIFVNRHGTITDLSDKISIGGLWNRIAQDLGLGYLGAGKVMGLAGYGNYANSVANVIQNYLKNPNHKLTENDKKVIQERKKSDVAFTLQSETERLVKEQVFPLQTSDNLCIAGGVAYNGYVNELLCQYYKKVHIPPAVGDEGQALGTYMHANFVLNSNVDKPSVYSGAEYDIDTRLFDEYDWQYCGTEQLVKKVSAAISKGELVAWYQGRSESGNRALGNRSILADPRNSDTKDIINHTIKKREDFRPFAPAVLENYADDFFDIYSASPYMSRIIRVVSDKIPGVTHVDGTARVQTVSAKENHLFYRLINAFYQETGIPLVLNTSFNCQEPIVESPQEAINTFQKTNLNILVIGHYVIRKNHD